MFQENKAVASQNHDNSVSTDNISIPFDWLFGVILTATGLFFSVVWWVRGMSAKVDSNSKAIETILARCVNEHNKMDNWHDKLQEDLRRQFRGDITQSATDICHGFELFAVEMRSDLKRLHEKIDERNEAIAELDKKQEKQGKKLDLLGGEFSSLIAQLRARDINVHVRERDVDRDQD